MPHSPFTRFLAFSIVAAHAVILLWPDPWVQVFGVNAMMLLPLVVMLFTWNAVRDAPVFNDLAFHRTLPTDDAQVFRRTLLIHGMVLLGIALVVAVYCLLLNFSWQVMFYGMALLTVPVWSFMAACGLATGASTSNQHGKSWSYIATFAVPVLAALLMHNVRTKYFPHYYGHYQAGQLRVIVLAAAVLYPVCWWLVSVKRRRTTGLLLGMVVGAGLPWLSMFGKVPASPGFDEVDAPAGSPVTLTKKAGLIGDGKWVRVDSLIGVEGLREGEYLELKRISAGRGMEIRACLVPDDAALADAGVYDGGLFAGRFSGGDVRWGKRAVWDDLRRQVSAHGSFVFWDSKLNVPSHPAVLKLGETAPILGSEDWTYSKPQTRGPITTDPLAGSWKNVWGDVYRMEKAGEVGMESGGSFRLAKGGIIQSSGLRQEHGRHKFSIRKYYEYLSEEEAPWFNRKKYEGGRPQPWVIAVDEAGKQAFALGPFFSKGGDPEILLGGVETWEVDLGGAVTSEQIARLEMLRKCRVHVFFRKWVKSFKQETVEGNGG